MRCFRARKLIDDHVSGLLPPHRNDQMRRHLDVCASCGDEAIALRAVTDAMPVFGDLSPPIGAFDRILERIEALPLDAFDAAPPSPTLRVLKGSARWAAASGLAAAAVLAAATTVKTLDESAVAQRRGSAVAAITQPRWRSDARTAGTLKPGEERAARVTVITPDLHLGDGLLRGAPTRAAVPVSTVSFDLFGNRPR